MPFIVAFYTLTIIDFWDGLWLMAPREFFLANREFCRFWPCLPNPYGFDWVAVDLRGGIVLLALYRKVCSHDGCW